MNNPNTASLPGPTKNDPRVLTGWAMFDWANSAFALVITVAIFPPYFLNITDDVLNFGPITISDSTLWSFCISAAYIMIAIVSPWLSGIADASGRKMFFLKTFTAIGSFGCLSLLWFNGMSTLWVGTIGFILAMIGFAGGLVFYNSYLPEIATEDMYDRVSARGFAYGFIGSVLLLIVNLVMLLRPEIFGLPAEDTLPARISFAMVGLWWIGFSQIPFRRLPKDEPTGSDKLTVMARRGWKEIKKVWGDVQHQEQIKRFLLSFFCYSMGAQTILYVAAIFAEKELSFATDELIYLVLVLQIVGIGGAYLFAWISEKKGNVFSLISMLLIWTLICILAYIVEGKQPFYFVAALVGLVMGGIQSLSRSTYSKLLPEDTPDTTSYFSFYDVLEKSAIVLGSFSFGLAELITGDIRNSILVLGSFFVVSVIILSRLKVQPAEEEEVEVA